MPDRDHVLGWVGGEIRPQPDFLRRSGQAAADLRLQALAVEDDHMPSGANVVAIVSAVCWAGGRSEVAEVAARAAGDPLMVAGGRAGARLGATPRGVVAVRVLGLRPAEVGVVARGEYVAGHAVEEQRGRLVARIVAFGDVTRADEHRVAARRGCEGPGRPSRDRRA